MMGKFVVLLLFFLIFVSLGSSFRAETRRIDTQHSTKKRNVDVSVQMTKENEDSILLKKWRAAISLAATLQILSSGNVAIADSGREKDFPTASELQSQLQSKLLGVSGAGEKEVFQNNQPSKVTPNPVMTEAPIDLQSQLESLTAAPGKIASNVAGISDAALNGLNALTNNFDKIRVDIDTNDIEFPLLNVAGISDAARNGLSVLTDNFDRIREGIDTNIEFTLLNGDGISDAAQNGLGVLTNNFDKIREGIDTINDIEFPSFDDSIAKARTSVTSVLENLQVNVAESMASTSASFQIEQEIADLSSQLREAFSFKLSGSSKILTTTTRPEVTVVQSPKTTWIRSAIEELQSREYPTITPEAVSEQVQLLIASLPKDWRVAPLVLGVVIFADALQHSAFLSSVVSEQKGELLAMRRRLEQMEAMESNSTKLLDTLRQESLVLVKEVDSLLTELEARTEQVVSLNATLSRLGGRVDTAVVASLRAEVATVGTKLADARGEIFQLRKAKKIGDEESKLKIEQLQLQMQELQDTQQSLLAAMMGFLVEEAFITPELAAEVFVNTDSVVKALSDTGSEQSPLRQNRMKLTAQNEELQQQMTVAQDQIESLQEKLQKGLSLAQSYDSVLVQLKERVESLEGQLVAATQEAQQAKSQEVALRSEFTSLAAKVAQLQETSDKRQDVKEYVGDLAAENDDLKQRLMSSDDKIFEMQQEMQAKLDDANAMVKDLKILLKNSIKSKSKKEDTYV